MDNKHFVWIVPLVLVIGFVIGYISAFKPIVNNYIEGGTYTLELGDNLKDVIIQESKCANLDNYVKVSGDDKFSSADCEDIMNLYNTKCFI